MSLQIITNGMVMVLNTEDNTYHQYQLFIDPADGNVTATEILGADQIATGSELPPQMTSMTPTPEADLNTTPRVTPFEDGEKNTDV